MLLAFRSVKQVSHRTTNNPDTQTRKVIKGRLDILENVCDINSIHCLYNLIHRIAGKRSMVGEKISAWKKSVQ